MEIAVPYGQDEVTVQVADENLLGVFHPNAVETGPERETLLRALEKRADERYRVIAKSPAGIVNGTDNINSEIVSPKLFEKYIISFYNKQAKILRKKDKILEDHMDGKLMYLKDLISKMNLDVVEAFTPPPMGDLSLAEARSAWKRKVKSLSYASTRPVP